MVSIEELRAEFGSEVGRLTASWYVWKGLNNIAAADRAVARVLNANPGAWAIILHSLQTTFFITLTRLFDNDADSFTVDRFLQGCKAGIDQFSRDALRVRKLAATHGVGSELVDQALEGVYEASTADFDRLEVEVAKYRDRIQPYKRIRNKLMAHRDHRAIRDADLLFGRTSVADVEYIIVLLHRIRHFVDELYLNGRKTDLISHRVDEEDTVLRDLKSLCARLVAGGRNAR